MARIRPQLLSFPLVRHRLVDKIAEVLRLPPWGLPTHELIDLRLQRFCGGALFLENRCTLAFSL